MKKEKIAKKTKAKKVIKKKPLTRKQRTESRVKKVLKGKNTKKKIKSVKSKAKKDKLTAKQELFCKLYATRGEYYANGTAAYCEAYNIDTMNQVKYNSARKSAFDNLTKPNILARIREILEIQGLNDEYVDAQLGFVIDQNADLHAKMSGIKEYNKLKKRIDDKMKEDKTIVINFGMEKSQFINPKDESKK